MSHPRSHLRRGFTIIELVVSVGIVVLLIFSVGIVFRSTSRSVGVSQSVMELLSNSAAIQQQMEADINGLNKNGFLVIRSGTFTDPTTNITRRCDMISFLASGTFQHRTGSTTASSPFTDSTTAPNGFVWWGQLALAQGSGAGASPTNPRVFLNADQTYHVPLTQVPTGLSETDYTLGRSVILLVPKSASGNNESPNGTSIAAYPNNFTLSPNLAAIDYAAGTGSGAVPAVASGESNADITQSRVDAAQTNPFQIMAFLQQAVTTRDTIGGRYEADHYCYRRAALRSPYDTEMVTSGVPNFVNGYFRTHTIALQGVPTFAVEWTDGSVYTSANDLDPTNYTAATGAGNNKIGSDSPLLGTTRWYGWGNARSGNNADGVIDPLGTVATTPNGDKYTAVFSYDNKAQWPVALRFRYHIADPSGRLPAGREVVQIIKLPS
jgi:type II secretory pathway pseudopilin PulG